jgi:hypothetical protein
MAIEVQIVFDRENKNAINLPTAKARILQFGRVVKKVFFSPFDADIKTHRL